MPLAPAAQVQRRTAAGAACERRCRAPLSAGTAHMGDIVIHPVEACSSCDPLAAAPCRRISTRSCCPRAVKVQDTGRGDRRRARARLGLAPTGPCVTGRAGRRSPEKDARRRGGNGKTACTRKASKNYPLREPMPQHFSSRAGVEPFGRRCPSDQLLVKGSPHRPVCLRQPAARSAQAHRTRATAVFTARAHTVSTRRVLALRRSARARRCGCPLPALPTDGPCVKTRHLR